MLGGIGWRGPGRGARGGRAADVAGGSLESTKCTS